jgi:hypothetical protein
MEVAFDPLENKSLAEDGTGFAVGRGSMQMGGFGHPSNMAPGIMGPGGPLLPLDMGSAMSGHPFGRGFVGPLAGMPLPGGVTVGFSTGPLVF